MKNSNTLLERVADLGVSCCLHTKLGSNRVTMLTELDAETKQYLFMNFKVSIFGVDGFEYNQEVINCEKTHWMRLFLVLLILMILFTSALRIWSLNLMN